MDLIQEPTPQTFIFYDNNSKRYATLMNHCFTWRIHKKEATLFEFHGEHIYLSQKKMYLNYCHFAKKYHLTNSITLKTLTFENIKKLEKTIEIENYIPEPESNPIQLPEKIETIELTKEEQLKVNLENVIKNKKLKKRKK